jgi:hypothetical protein
MEWDPEILARLRSSREDEALRLKERTTLPRRAASQSMTPEIKMVVGEWHTDEYDNRSRIIYNARTEDFEDVCGLPCEASLAC